MAATGGFVLSAVSCNMCLRCQSIQKERHIHIHTHSSIARPSSIQEVSLVPEYMHKRLLSFSLVQKHPLITQSGKIKIHHPLMEMVETERKRGSMEKMDKKQNKKKREKSKSKDSWLRP